jgi:hypothetical protein
MGRSTNASQIIWHLAFVAVLLTMACAPGSRTAWPIAVLAQASYMLAVAG